MNLAKRLAISARRNERYRTDPAFRLSRINYTRGRSGLPLLDEPPPMGVRPNAANNRQRDEKGRFA